MPLAHIFDRTVAVFARDLQQLFLWYDDFYNIAIEVIPFNQDRELRVLDLGAGTGLLSSLVAARYPRAQLTLVDISSSLLDIAKRRFTAGDGSRVSFLAMDYRTDHLAGTFDLVISDLSIHHLTDTNKQTLFARIHHCLEPGGLFVNADRILGENVIAEKLYQRIWRRKVLENGISPSDLTAALAHMQEDRPAPLASQLQWLKGAGFVDVTSWYQYCDFAVYSGAKQLGGHP